MVIDNVGFDLKAMAAMSCKDFVMLHLENDAICPGKSVAERKEWLRAAYKAICQSQAQKQLTVSSTNKGQGIDTPASFKNSGNDDNSGHAGTGGEGEG